MKNVIVISLVLLLSACLGKRDKEIKKDSIEGAWSSVSSTTLGNCGLTNHYLWNTIIFYNDSIFNYEDKLFIGSKGKYKIFGDSIEVAISDTAKYRYTFRGEKLHFEGYNSYKGCMIREKKTFERIENNNRINAIYNQEPIHLAQLSFGNWCRSDNTNIEKRLSADSSTFYSNMNVKEGLQYFPYELDFSLTSMKLNDNLDFKIDSNTYTIAFFSSSELSIFHLSNDTTFHMRYDLYQ